MSKLTHSTEEGMAAVEAAAIARGDVDGPGCMLAYQWAQLIEDNTPANEVYCGDMIVGHFSSAAFAARAVAAVNAHAGLVQTIRGLVAWKPALELLAPQMGGLLREIYQAEATLNLVEAPADDAAPGNHGEIVTLERRLLAKVISAYNDCGGIGLLRNGDQDGLNRLIAAVADLSRVSAERERSSKTPQS